MSKTKCDYPGCDEAEALHRALRAMQDAEKEAADADD